MPVAPGPATHIGGRNQGNGYNPQSSREFYRGADGQRLWSVPGGSPDDGGSIVDCQRRQKTKLALAQVQPPADRREDEQRDRVQQEDRSHRNRDLFLVRIGDRRDGRDRRSSADRRAKGDQVTGLTANPEELT